MTEPIIQRTTRGDIPSLENVVDETGLFPSQMLPEMLEPTLAGTTEAFWLTCHLDARATGLCYVVPEQFAAGTWNMLALGVQPNHQGKGLGKALVRAAEQYLSERRQRVLIVETSGTERFETAREFYVRIGFDLEARIRDFWAEGDDKVIFRKAL